MPYQNTRISKSLHPLNTDQHKLLIFPPLGQHHGASQTLKNDFFFFKKKHTDNFFSKTKLKFQFPATDYF